MQIIYDGQCPFCTRYTRLLALRKEVGNVELIDARYPHPLVEEVKATGHDLNEGMAVFYNGQWFMGADAIHLLGKYSGEHTVASRINRLVFRSGARSRMLYPVLRFFRNLTLKFLGRRPIR